MKENVADDEWVVKDMPGRWTVKLTIKRHGIRGHKVVHWPPLEASARAEGIEWIRCHRWLVRQMAELAATGRGGEVIRVEFEPVR